MFRRLGSWCHRHRLIVVVLWLAALVGINATSTGIGTAFTDQLSLPSVESKQGIDLLQENFAGQGASETATIVIQADSQVTDPAVAPDVQAYLDEVAALPAVIDVGSPYTPGNELQVSLLGDAAGTIAYATVDVDPDLDWNAAMDLGQQVMESAPAIDGVRFEYGGSMFGEFEPPAAELIGLAFAIVILILAFGSVMAMGLPIGVGLAGIGVGAGLIGLLSHVTNVPDMATTLGIMIGLGVGIDYALFIVTRYREQARAGCSVGESVAIAIDTSGRAVAFAGLTVVISLLGMLLMGVPMVSGLGIGAAAVVTVTMLASLTLLPALLGFAGGRIEITRWRGIVAAGFIAIALVGAGLKISAFLIGVPLALVVLIASAALAPLRREVPHRAERPMERTIAYRWSRAIQAHPWWSTFLSAGLLVVLAIPVLSLRLGFSDAGNNAPETTTRKAYDLLAEGFGPGFNGPLTVVAALPEGTSPESLAPIGEALGSAPGVAFATPAIPNDPAAPTAVIWRVIPDTAPQDEATSDLVRVLRDDVIPTAEAGTGVDAIVTGSVAMQVDFSDYLTARLPLFFGAVLGLSFLLLMAVFRSLLVPLKAVVMNLLSIGAAYGIVVAVFQWGWGGSLLGIAGAPIEPFVPMMLFAIVFGLSMDYEVFLLSRIKEEYDRTGDAHRSVADGLAATARVITAAAAIMVVVFGAFLLEEARVIKLMGLGLAIAVFLDATVVRMLLVPATMELLGAKNWWLPRWLDRLLPHLDVEGHVEPPTGRGPADGGDGPGGGRGGSGGPGGGSDLDDGPRPDGGGAGVADDDRELTPA